MIENDTGEGGYRGYAFRVGVAEGSTEGSVTQTVQIPATGNAHMYFGLSIQNARAGYSATDQLDVLLDDISVLDTPILAKESKYHHEYTLVRADVSGFADGNSHDLRFETIQTGNTRADGATIFRIDHVYLSTGSDCRSSWGIALSPSVLSFGHIEPGTSSTLDVEVHNTGASLLIGEAYAYPPLSVDRKFAGYTIEPGGVATLPITYTAPQPGGFVDHWGNRVRFTGGGDEELTIIVQPVVGTSSPFSRRVIINEVSAWSDSGPTDQDHDHSDWIELRNYEYEAILLDGWQLEYAPDLELPTTWDFPIGTTIAAGQYLVVYASGKDGTASDMGLHTNFTLDHTRRSTLTLVNADGVATRHSPLEIPVTIAPDEAWSYVDPADLTSRPDPNNSGPEAGHFIWVGAVGTTLGKRNHIPGWPKHQ